MANISKVTLLDGVTYDLKDSRVDDLITGKQNLIKSASVSIAVSDWSSKTAVKTVTGVTSTNKIIVTYAPSSKDEYLAADVYVSAQGIDSLTFKCTTIPSTSVTANVMIID